MEPISLIVSSLVAGASAALKPTAEKAVKDAYEGIKSLIVKRFEKKEVVDEIEQNPSSINQSILTDELKNVGVEKDIELVEAARKLIAAMNKHEKEKTIAGINIEDIEAEFLKIKKVHSTGDFNLKGSTFSGGIEIGDLSAGETPNPQ